MNREERQHIAKLRWIARSPVKLAELGRLEGPATCDCTLCRLIRAGVCLQCAASAFADFLEYGPGSEVTVTPCSPACREGVERYVAELVLP
jgi:hypothetical protein